jgi:hypothetical protein
VHPGNQSFLPAFTSQRSIRESLMADDRSNRGAQDRSRVNVHEDYYKAAAWTKEQLAAAVQKVGVSVDAVAKQLGQ